MGNFKPTTVSLMDYFAANIGGTPWYEILTAYYYIFSSHKNQILNTTSFGGHYFLSSPAGNTSLTNFQIEDMLADAINNGTIPLSDTGVYSVMFPGYLNVSFQGKYWLRDWCSFHGAFVLGSGDTIKYSVVGDPSSAPGRSGQVCIPLGGNPTANGDPSADNMAVGYAQQLANIVTDGTYGGWFSDKNGLEAGSACAYNFGIDLLQSQYNVLVGSKKFLLSSVWLPLIGCVI